MLSFAGTFGAPLVPAGAGGTDPAIGLLALDLPAAGWLLVTLTAIAALGLLSYRERRATSLPRRRAPHAAPRWISGAAAGQAHYRAAHS